MEELREKLKASCAPEIIFSSIEAHEDVHTRQVDQLPAISNDGKTHSKGQLEVHAYAVSARVLLDWLKRRCQGPDLGAAETRVLRLEGATEARYRIR